MIAVAVASPMAAASGTGIIEVRATQNDYPQSAVTVFQLSVRNVSTDVARVTVTASLEGEFVQLIPVYTEQWSYLGSSVVQGTVGPGVTADGLQFNVARPGDASAPRLPYSLTVTASAPGLVDGVWAHSGTV